MKFLISLLSNTRFLINAFSIYTVMIKSVADNMIGVKETPSTIINYKAGQHNPIAGIKGIEPRIDGIVLRKDKNPSGILIFKEDNPNEDWSFSFTIKDFHLTFPEQGGVYLWYTDETQDRGNYRGALEHFNGLMAGIEFIGSSPELIFALNDGHNYENTEEETMYRDPFNKERLEGVEELTIKVILTKINFKIELYDHERLIYDALRHTGNHAFSDLGRKKFSITAYYTEKTEKSFVLTDAQLYKREELSSYNPDKVYTRRESDFTLDEVRHFISHFNHFFEYTRAMLGTQESSRIKQLEESLIKNINKTKEDIMESMGSHPGTGINLSEIEKKILSMQKSFSDLDHLLKVLEENQSKKSSYLIYLIVGVGVSILGVIGVKEYKASKTREKNL